MKNNVGNVDRAIRILLAVVLAGLYFTNTITGTFGIVLLIFTGVFLVTSAIGFCPLYKILGLNTCKVKQ